MCLGARRQLADHGIAGGIRGVHDAPAGVAALAGEMQVIRTGTDNVSMEVDYGNLELPAVIRRTSRTTVEAMSANGMSTLDIPAFLRKQAD